MQTRSFSFAAGLSWPGLLLGLIIAGGCSSSSDGPLESAAGNHSTTDGSTVSAASKKSPLVILVAASATDVLRDLAQSYESQTGQPVTLSAGASNALAQQVIAGAPADLFLSASEAWARELKERGLVDQIQPLLTGRLVIVVPRGNPADVRGPQDLTGAPVERVVLAAENVPAGRYADQALKALELAARLASDGKVVRGQDVRSVLGYVERGEVEAGIVYATDARASANVEVVYTFEADRHDRILYPLVLLKSAHPEARAFFEFLQSEEAVQAFRQAGFSTIPRPSDSKSAPVSQGPDHVQP